MLTVINKLPHIQCHNDDGATSDVDDVDYSDVVVVDVDDDVDDDVEPGKDVLLELES